MIGISNAKWVDEFDNSFSIENLKDELVSQDINDLKTYFRIQNLWEDYKTDYGLSKAELWNLNHKVTVWVNPLSDKDKTIAHEILKNGFREYYDDSKQRIAVFSPAYHNVDRNMYSLNKKVLYRDIRYEKRFVLRMIKKYGQSVLKNGVALTMANVINAN